MFGDHRGINKTLSLLKAISGFYMVYMHGMTVFGLAIPAIDFTQLHWAYKATAALRFVLSTMLPAYAGFFLRNQWGPYLENHRLQKSFLGGAAKFFLVACLLEGFRLLFVTGSFVYFFNWQALHFIAFAMILTNVLALIDDRLLLAAFFGLLVFGAMLVGVAQEFMVLPEQIDSQTTAVASWIWSLAFSGLMFWFLHLFKPYFAKFKKPIAPKVFGAAIALISVSAGVLLQPVVAAKTRAVVSFVNLPLSALATNSFDDNYWCLFVAYPSFLAGYFLRAFVFDLKYKKYFPLTVAIGVVGMIELFLVGYPALAKVTGPHTTWTKRMFMSTSGTPGGLATFYLMLVALYFLVGRKKTPRLDKFSFASRSILVLYLIHGIFLDLAVKIFPYHYVEQIKNRQVTDILWIVQLFVVGAYLVSLFFTSRITTLLERWSSKTSAV
jgi:hypothetical protein